MTTARNNTGLRLTGMTRHQYFEMMADLWTGDRALFVDIVRRAPKDGAIEVLGAVMQRLLDRDRLQAALFINWMVNYRTGIYDTN
jgi:hypothetical protein